MLQNVLFLIIVLVTNIIQAITGFAGTLLAMPASIMLVGADDAKVMLNLVTLATCVILAVRNRKYIQWKILIGSWSSWLSVWLWAYGSLI